LQCIGAHITKLKSRTIVKFYIYRHSRFISKHKKQRQIHKGKQKAEINKITISPLKSFSNKPVSE